MLKVDVTLPIKYSMEDVKSAISSYLPIDASDISDVEILKRSLDLTCTKKPVYKAQVAFSTDSEREAGLKKIRNKTKEYERPCLTLPSFKSDFRPVVVGAGPAGLFAALVLAESGARPIVIERGERIEDRDKAVALFNAIGMLDLDTNIQFGEGGAGTYSDGKLKVGARDKYKLKVLDEFIAAGANADIAFSDTAHLGTDKLGYFVKKIREKIISLGGEFLFSAKLTDIKISDGVLKEITYYKKGRYTSLDIEALILATGHSAKDTYLMLKEVGLKMVPKGFGIGLRIEHPREYIDKLVYKDAYGEIPNTASYHLVTHLKNGRSVYSFCMCPGGTVVAAASEKFGIVTNGMSEYSRKAENSNAALLVSVTPEDFGSDDPLAGIELQRKIEMKAYDVTGFYRAPVQSLESFLKRDKARLGSVNPTYPIGTETVKIDRVLPKYITDSLRIAMSDFEDWMPGYSYMDAVLTAPETRTTAPVRILRDENLEAEGVRGIYPSGEGAGYAGGIISSAVDGIKCAEALILKYGNK